MSGQERFSSESVRLKIPHAVRNETSQIGFLLLFYLICSVLEFHGLNNGTPLRYSFSLWIQPTNTNVKIIPLQNGLKYTYTTSVSITGTQHKDSHTKNQSRSAHVLLTLINHIHTPTHNRIHSQKKTIINFQSISYIFHNTHNEQDPPQTRRRPYRSMELNI